MNLCCYKANIFTNKLLNRLWSEMGLLTMHSCCTSCSFDCLKLTVKSGLPNTDFLVISVYFWIEIFDRNDIFYRLDPWQTGPLTDLIFYILDPWQTGPLTNWTLDRLDPWQTGPLKDWTLDRFDIWQIRHLTG